MTDKLSFAIENAEMVDESPNSNFAVLSLDFFASGENLHDMYVSEETLMRTADSIKNCPLVWKYDETLDDIFTHDKDEVPCGFVPETSPIENKKMPDGRTMLSAIAYVWKRYTGELLNFFKRDGGKKPVSVEMSVYDTRLLPNGLTELLDFRYEGITVLGSFITPAIPLASATVLAFSEIEKEYNEDLKKEFNFNDSDLIIPENVKNNARKGLKLKKEYGTGGTSVGLAFAHYLTKNKVISPEKVKTMTKYFTEHKNNLSQSDQTNSENIDWLLFGGNSAWKWVEDISKKLDKKEEIIEFGNELVTFPYTSIKDVNPALKGIEPPITLGQANEIAKQADAIGNDDEKNGWAIAISSFKKTHKVEDGHWVKKDLNKKEEMSVKEKEEEIKMAEDTAKEEEKESPAEEKAETPAEEKKEKEKGIEKKFEFPKNIDTEKMCKMFAEDEEDEVKMAKEEIEKGEFANPEVVMSGMFAKMCKMEEIITKMAEKEKVYMGENEDLKKFKADVEKSQKFFAIEKTLQELAEKVIIPEDAKEEMLAESEKYSLADIESWRMYCKAKSFDFALKEPVKSDVIRVAMPFGTTTQKKQNDLWA